MAGFELHTMPFPESFSHRTLGIGYDTAYFSLTLATVLCPTHTTKSMQSLETAHGSDI